MTRDAQNLEESIKQFDSISKATGKLTSRMANFVQTNTSHKLMKKKKARGEQDDQTSNADEAALLSSRVPSSNKMKKDDLMSGGISKVRKIAYEFLERQKALTLKQELKESRRKSTLGE